MPKVALYNMAGAQVGDVALNDEIFAAEINESAVHQVVVNYLANQRQGTQSTKTRSEVSGGGIKPWRQKGTGRARQGSIRAPQWKGGGVALGPKPRSYKYTLNKKVKRLAMKSVLTAKVNDSAIYVIDNLSVDAYSTKAMKAMLDALKIEGKALIVTPEKNELIYRSARNIAGVTVSMVGTMNVYEVLNHGALVIAQDAISKIEEVLA